MINYIAHWDWVLTQSRGSIVESIEGYKFRSICPIDNKAMLSKYYKDSIDWKINRKNSFGLNGIFKLIKILNTLEDNSIIHIFTLKSGFIYMISKLFVKKDFKAVLSITGLGYLFSKKAQAKMLKTFLRPIFYLCINKIYEVIIFQNIDDQEIFLEYSRFKNKTELIKIMSPSCDMVDFVSITENDSRSILNLRVKVKSFENIEKLTNSIRKKFSNSELIISEISNLSL